MEEIINAVFSEISNCSHPEHGSSRSLRACLDAKVESLAQTTLYLVEDNKDSCVVREEIKQLVRQAIHDCGDSLEEIGYDSPPLMQQCLLKRSDRLVDMAIDLITEDLPTDGYVAEIKKQGLEDAAYR